MQKRSKSYAAITYAHLDLPLDFPLISSAHSPTDDPISSLHVHNYLELGFCQKGSGLFMVNEKILSFQAGDCVVIGNEAHFARSTEGVGSSWTFINCDPCGLLPTESKADLEAWRALGGTSFANIISPGDNEILCSFIAHLGLESLEKKKGYQQVCRGLVVSILALLQRYVNSDEAEPIASPTHIKRISPALEYLSSHFQDTIASLDLANTCYLSTVHFRRLFVKAMGCSPRTYQMRLRIEMAKTLLRQTDHSILQISLMVGFQSLSSFNRQFKTLASLSPSSWRK